MPLRQAIQNPARFAELGSLGRVCRLGLSSRGNTSLDPQDVLEASVRIALIAPNGRTELEEDLSILDDWRGFRESEYAALCEHGDRVHRHAGAFP